MREHLSESVDKIIIQGNRQNARGRILRHEIKHSIDSIHSLSDLLNSTLRVYRNHANKVEKELSNRLSFGGLSGQSNDIKFMNLKLADQEKVYKFLRELPADFEKLTELAKDITSRSNSLLDTHSQLYTQIESIEKPELYDLEKFLGISAKKGQPQLDQTNLNLALQNACLLYTSDAADE